MKLIYTSFLLLFSASVSFAQEGITLLKKDNSHRKTFISNGTKISVVLTDGTKIKGTLADEDSYTMLVNQGGKSSIINYSSVSRIVTYKQTDYFSFSGDMWDGMGGCTSNDCGSGCGNVGSVPAVGVAVAIVVGVGVAIVATELLIEGTTDLINDNYYSMDNWKFAEAN